MHMKLTILNIARHRNGMDGAPFHAVIFRDQEPEGGVKLGIVFEQAWHTAVLDIAKLVGGDIEFGTNSWRGDLYEPHLRKALKQLEAERMQP